MNPAGKSYVCILHEYVQHALKKQPCYQFKEIGGLPCRRFLLRSIRFRQVPTALG